MHNGSEVNLTVTHIHNYFTALLDFVWDYPAEPAPERWNQEGKTSLDLQEQEIVSGIGISWPYANLHLDSDT